MHMIWAPFWTTGVWLCAPATTRASLAFYNTREEIDRLVEAVRYARQVLA
jgi:cysteine desulfurase/selenocysteine lyase